MPKLLSRTGVSSKSGRIVIGRYCYKSSFGAKNDRPGDDGTLRIVKLLVFLLGVIDLASVSRIERELGGLEECVYWLWSVHGSIREWLEVRYIADRIWNCGQTPCWLGLAGADAARQHERAQGLLWWGRSISLSI